VEKAINDWAPKPDENKLEKEAFAKSKETLMACGDKIECYLAKIEEPALQSKRSGFCHQGCLHARHPRFGSGTHGIDPQRDHQAPAQDQERCHQFSAGKAVDHLTPAGDKAAADAIKK